MYRLRTHQGNSDSARRGSRTFVCVKVFVSREIFHQPLFCVDGFELKTGKRGLSDSIADVAVIFYFNSDMDLIMILHSRQKQILTGVLRN